MAIGLVFLCIGVGFATSMIALLSGHSVFAAFLIYSATGTLTGIVVVLFCAAVLYRTDKVSGVRGAKASLTTFALQREAAGSSCQRSKNLSTISDQLCAAPIGRQSGSDAGVVHARRISSGAGLG